MELSARNQLKGEIVRVKSGTIMAEVEVKIEPGNVVAAITDGSLKRLGLKAGDRVTVIIKATEVLIGREREPGMRFERRRAARYRVVRLHSDITAPMRRPAAHHALGQNSIALVCVYRPHTAPALARESARRPLGRRAPVATSNGDMV